MPETVRYKHIWGVSWPLMLSGVAWTVINVTDAAFLGRVGEVELGAVGLGGICYLVFMMAGIGMSIGAQIIIARLHGEGRHGSIGDVADRLFVLMAVMAAGLWALHMAVASAITDSVFSSEAIREAVHRYMDVRVLGFLPTFLFAGYRALLTGIARTGPISYASAAMALSNIGLNWLLVPGNLGFPKMGLEGAAWASVMSESIALLVMAAWVGFGTMTQGLGCFRFKRLDAAGFLPILKIGTPVMAQHVVALCSWLAFFTAIESMGERALAISNVARSVYSVLMIPLIGIAQATQSLVSTLIGQGRSDLLWLLIRRIIALSLATSLVLTLINLAVPGMLLSVFTDSTALKEGALPVIWVMSACILFFALAMAVLSAVSGTGATRIAFAIEVVTLAFYIGFVLWTVHVMHWPLPAVWLAEIVYFVFIGLLSVLYLRSGRWKDIKVG